MLINLYNRLPYRDEEGQALVEYALILGLVAVVAIGALTTLGTNVTAVLSQIAAAIPGAKAADRLNAVVPPPDGVDLPTGRRNPGLD